MQVDVEVLLLGHHHDALGARRGPRPKELDLVLVCDNLFDDGSKRFDPQHIRETASKLGILQNPGDGSGEEEGDDRPDPSAVLVCGDVHVM